MKKHEQKQSVRALKHMTLELLSVAESVSLRAKQEDQTKVFPK